ncbi:MAG: 1-acyl-sn-glycerol-3-phosphate acyltransferase [Bacteroidaceae bacterium]
MTIKKTLEVNVEKILRDKAGTKAKYVPRFVVGWLKRILHQDEINAFLVEHQNEEGVDWLRSVIDYLNVTIVVKGLENLPKERNERYTFVSNHPLGGIDGVALGAVFGKHFDGNIRYLLNDILMNLPGLKPLGIPVNVTGAQNRSIFEKVDEVFKSDHHIIVFPAGLCSRMIKGRVQDLPWKKTAIQKSVENNRSIVPIYFSGQNSKRFYRIANISKALGLKFNLAMLFLADEVYRNRGQQFEIHIGKPIAPNNFDKRKATHEWAQWLRAKVYELNN